MNPHTVELRHNKTKALIETYPYLNGTWVPKKGEFIVYRDHPFYTVRGVIHDFNARKIILYLVQGSEW